MVKLDVLKKIASNICIGVFKLFMLIASIPVALGVLWFIVVTLNLIAHIRPDPEISNFYWNALTAGFATIALFTLPVCAAAGLVSIMIEGAKRIIARGKS